MALVEGQIDMTKQFQQIKYTPMKNSATPSLFQLIQLFRTGSQKTLQIINPVAHCEKEALHDYYCDKEQSIN